MCTVPALKCVYVHISHIHAHVLKSLVNRDSTQPPVFLLTSPPAPLTSAQILGKAKHCSFSVCMTCRRWCVKQEVIRANYSALIIEKNSMAAASPVYLVNQHSHHIIIVHSASLFTARQKGKGT